MPTIPTRTVVWNTPGIYPGYAGYGTLPTVSVVVSHHILERLQRLSENTHDFVDAEA